VIAAAIHWLAPWLLAAQVATYSAAVEREAARQRVDPLLVVALIYHESRFHAGAVSPGGSHGLMQVRVSRTHRARWLGRERALRVPEVNVRVGVGILSMWRAYHRRRCLGSNDPEFPDRHPFWSHFQWGSRVRSAASGRRVGATYRALVRRFRKAGGVL